MIKYLIVLLSFVTVIGAAQTPAPIYRIPNTTTAFSSPLMAGALLCDIGSGKTYRILRAVAVGQSLSTLTKLVDYRELNSSPVVDPADNSLYTQLIYGTVTWSGTGLTYNVSNCQYYILGNIYNSAADDVTLDAADVSLNRFDVIYADTLGHIGKITGDPAADPFEPLVDPESQIKLTIIYVSAGATIPETNVDIIYRENNEWTTAVIAQSFGTTISFANTTTPYEGTKCVNAVSTGSLRNSQFKFTGTSKIFADTDVFIFYLKSSAAWSSTSQIAFRWYNGTAQISSTITITNGSYGYNSASSAWQKIAIPMQNFKLTGISGNILTVTFAGTWTAKTLKFDNIEIQSTSVVSSGLQGTGVKDYLAKWIDSKTLGKSIISESAGKIGVNILPGLKTFDVNGSTKLRDTLFLATVPTNATGGSKSYLTVDGETVKKFSRPDSDAVIYAVSAETGTGGAWLKILGSDGSKDSVKLAAGTNMTSITRTDGNTITFNAAPASGATYTISAETGSGGSWLKILGSDGSKDSVKLAAGTNMTSIVRTDSNTITFNAAPATGATYGISAETGAGGAWAKILGSDLSKDSIKMAAGTNMTSIVRTDANTITFNAAAGGETYTVGTVAKATGAWIKILGSAGSKDSVFLKSGTGITVARYDNDTITVSAGAASVAGMVDDINFEFADILMGMAQTYTLDIKASYGYTITSASFETDTGTLTGIAVKIGSTAVTSLSSVTADAIVDETTATGANTVVAGDRIYIITTTGYTGVPTVLRGKLKITRT